MTNNQNNSNVFKTSLGAVSKMKKWNNFPTGSPKNAEGSYDFKLNNNPKTASPKSQTSGKSMNMKAKKIQATPPPKDLVINNIAQEISILNYKGNPLPIEKKQRACSIYFRGDNNRRLIAGFLILQTLKDLGTTQKKIKEIFPYMSKGFISNVFKESITAEWFYKEQSQVSQNLFIYYASPIMVDGAYTYYNTIESSRDELLFMKCETNCCS